MKSIRAKMLMWFGLTLGLFMAFFGFTTYTTIKDTVIPLTSDLSQEILKARSAEIGRLIKGYLNEVKSIATGDTIRSGDFEAIGKNLRRVELSINPDFEMLLFTDTKGRYITTKGDTGNVADRGYWKAIMEKGHEYAISDPIISKATGERLFVVASVVTNQKGERIGIVAATVLLKTLSGIVEKIKIGESGVGWIVDNTGMTVAHPDQALPMKLNLLKSSALGYQGLEKIGRSIIKGESDQGRFVRPDGTKQMAIFTPIPNTPGWTFVIALQESELMEHPHRLMRSVIWLMSSMLAIVLLVVIIISRKITAPMLMLKEGVNIVSAGNLDHLLDIRTGDEIQGLAEAFNKMTNDLKEHRNTLEQKVEERTRDFRSAEAGLRVSEGRLADIINFLPVATLVVDRDGRTTHWNRAMESMTYLKAFDIIGKGDYEYSLPFYGKRRPMLIDLVSTYDDTIAAKYENVRRLEDILVAETFIPELGEDGIFVVVSASALHDSDGNLIGAIESIRNITDFRRAEALLKEAKEAADARSCELQEKNDRIMESIDYAERLQRSILPPLPHRLGISAEKCFVIWKPKDVVGGDMYWCRGDERFVLVAVVDCTGHGVPGALMTMAMGSILDGLPRDLYGQKPSSLLHSIHDSLKETLRQENKDSLANDGADIALCLLDKLEKRFLFAGAKLSLFVEKDGEVTEYKGVKHSVGYSHRKDVVFEDREIDWIDGSVVYMTTDGLLDQNGEEGKGGVGRSGFVKLLQSIAGKSFVVQERVVEQLIVERLKNVEQRDDITVVGFEIGENLEGRIGI